MIFQYTVDSVLDGAKTQTRRCVNDGDEAVVWDSVIVGVERNGRMKWALGGEYAVQPGRGKKGVGRIRVNNIFREQVRDITEMGAISEGCVFYTTSLDFEYLSARDAFAVIWDNIQPAGRRWDDNPEVWVLTFELVEESE